MTKVEEVRAALEDKIAVALDSAIDDAVRSLNVETIDFDWEDEYDISKAEEDFSQSIIEIILRHVS